MRFLSNIYRLGIKEFWSLIRDPAMLFLIVLSFTYTIYSAATSRPDTLNKAPIAIVDEDGSPLSSRIAALFYPPHFKHPTMIGLGDIDRVLDEGTHTFALVIPPDFQRDVLAGRSPALQLNIDATRMGQAFNGNSYIQQMINTEVNNFLESDQRRPSSPFELTLRNRFNPSLEQSWSGSITELINTVTMISIILTGAALIREREHGTIEHLLVMPVTPGEIMTSKIWSMGLVVLVATGLSLKFVIQGAIKVPIEGSIPLFLAGAALHLFATTSMGIFLGTIARSMPQFGLLLMLILLPLQMLSGGTSPRESMPEVVQNIMSLAPTTHFVQLSQAILFRGAGLDVVWKPLLILAVIGTVLFLASLSRFRKTITQMA